MFTFRTLLPSCFLPANSNQPTLENLQPLQRRKKSNRKFAKFSNPLELRNTLHTARRRPVFHSLQINLLIFYFKLWILPRVPQNELLRWQTCVLLNSSGKPHRIIATRKFFINSMTHVERSHKCHHIERLSCTLRIPSKRAPEMTHCLVSTWSSSLVPRGAADGISLRDIILQIKFPGIASRVRETSNGWTRWRNLKVATGCEKKIKVFCTIDCGGFWMEIFIAKRSFE